MKAEIQYIGPDQVGPHYVEGGLFPLGTPQSGYRVNVIVQTKQGDVVPARFLAGFDGGGFYTPHGKPLDVACWWHLPAAAPGTEREWFESQFTKWPDGIGPVGRRFKNYGKDIFGGWWLITPLVAVPKLEQIEDAYTHWLAAGRPQ